MYIYKFLNEENEVIYVGKSIDMVKRLGAHFGENKEDWKSEVRAIEIAEVYSIEDMNLFEVYFINKYKPKYNKSIPYINMSKHSSIEDLSFRLIKYPIKNYEYHMEVSEEDIEEIINRYEIHILKDRRDEPYFFNVSKNGISKETIDILKKKIQTCTTFVFDLKGNRENLKYISHFSNSFLFSCNDKVNNFLNIYDKNDNVFYFLLLYDIYIEKKSPNLKESDDLALNLLLNFMKNNKGVDKDGKTYLFIASKRMYNLLNEYTNKRLKIKKQIIPKLNQQRRKKIKPLKESEPTSNSTTTQNY